MDSVISAARALRGRLAEHLTGHPVVFIHVPKCGGTSISRALRQRYLISQQTIGPEESFRAIETFRGGCGVDRPALFAETHTFRQQTLLYLLHSNIRCVAAHVPFVEAAHKTFSGRYKFMTVLRDPVQRYFSHYFYSYRREAHAAIDEPLESFIESPRGKAYGALYSEFYSGLPGAADFTSRDAIERAKHNLAGCFSIVGFLDDIDGIRRQIREQLGVRVNIGHANKGKVPPTRKRAIITPEIEMRVTELCAPDCEIYDHARRIAAGDFRPDA